jgi:hypothetical protein
MQSNGSLIIVSKAIIKCKRFWFPLHCTLPLALPYSYKEYCRFTRCMNSLLACDLIEVCKNHLINCIHAWSHSVTLLSISEKSVGNPSSLRILPQEIVAYMSITIRYDRSSYKFQVWKTRIKLNMCVSTFNLFRI